MEAVIRQVCVGNQAPTVTNTELIPVIEHVALAPADNYAVPARVIEHVAPAPVIEHIAPAPPVTCFAPCQKLHPETIATVTNDASSDMTDFVNPQFSTTAVDASASQVIGSLRFSDEFAGADANMSPEDFEKVCGFKADVCSSRR